MKNYKSHKKFKSKVQSNKALTQKSMSLMSENLDPDLQQIYEILDTHTVGPKLLKAITNFKNAK